MNDADVLRRLSDLGHRLPPPPAPVASYVPVVRSGPFAFVAGQIAMENGHPIHPGRLGAKVSVEIGQEAAGLAALQALSALRDHLGGSLERLVRIAQVTVYVAADPEFVEHPAVANGASELLVAALGSEGRHARAAVGCSSLPLGACVEVAITAEVAP